MLSVTRISFAGFLLLSAGFLASCAGDNSQAASTTQNAAADLNPSCPDVRCRYSDSGLNGGPVSAVSIDPSSGNIWVATNGQPVKSGRFVPSARGWSLEVPELGCTLIVTSEKFGNAVSVKGSEACAAYSTQALLPLCARFEGGTGSCTQ